MPWNPLIAQVFYRKGIIETWGRGTLKIISLVEQAGLIPPEFEMAQGEVTVRFRPISYVPPSQVGHTLSLLQKEVLASLASFDSPATVRELQEKIATEIPGRTLQWNLSFLEELGLVERVGQSRRTRWRINRT